jgi:hypothetical protein
VSGDKLSVFDSDPFEDDDIDDSEFFDREEAIELADIRETRSWEVFLCFVEGMLTARQQSPKPAPVLDWRKLSAAAFEAVDAFSDVAKLEHAAHVERTINEPRDAT